MSLKSRIPDHQKERLRRLQRRLQRWRQRGVLDATYAAVHDGRTLNLCIGSSDASLEVYLSGPGGREVALGDGSAIESSRAWTVDVVDLLDDDGAYSLRARTARGDRALYLVEDPAAVPGDPAQDGEATYDGGRVARLSGGSQPLTIVVETTTAEPRVTDVVRNNDGTYALGVAHVADGAAITAHLRDASDTHDIGTVIDGRVTVTLTRIPVAAGRDQFWDLEVTAADVAPQRLRMSSPDLRASNGILSIPAFKRPEGSSLTVWKPYVAFDGGLTVTTSTEAMKGAA